jgi:cobyrinic acid a,c-diamide synthase
VSASSTIFLPRIVIAGLKGDGGKSLVSIALAARLTDRGVSIAPYKVGPDYIDAAWLGAAAKKPGRNLDTFLMSDEAVLESLGSHACDLAIIEGKRGLFDGLTEDGAHSTAELAKLIKAPVILVIDVTKTTRTAAAFVRGCQAMDPDLIIGGVILNRCATLRQENLIHSAIEAECNVPVLGAIPRLEKAAIPMRHLGLVCVQEQAHAEKNIDAMKELGQRHLNIDAIVSIAKTAPALLGVAPKEKIKRVATKSVGVFRGPAFSFYYPENLTALEAEGARLVDIDPMSDIEIPDSVDGLLVGGGFPELYANELSKNRSMLLSLRRRVNEGMPVYAECGGLMVLARSLTCGDETFEMADIIKADIVQTDRPVGHGYVEATADATNPIFEIGSTLRGHEFHYSKVTDLGANVRTALSLTRGSGVGGRRDGVVQDNVFASYTHVHALGTPMWAPSFFNAL